LLIKEGVAMQLISFSKNRKVKIFEGIISGAQYDGNTVTIVADGYGSQLMKPAYEKDQKLGGGCTSPREMVIDAITRSNSIRLGCPQSGYFELLKRMVENKYKEDYIWLYSDKFFFPTLRYTDMGINVYAPDEYWPLLTKYRINGISYFEQYQADYKAKAGYSAWDVITDAVNRVPGFVAAITDFDAGGGRVFFGKPEWTYVYTSKLDPQFWSRAKDVTKSSFESKVNVINNVVENEIENYERRIVESFNSLVKYEVQPVVMHEEKIKGFAFNIPEDIPTADESDGTIVYDIVIGTDPETNNLYDGDTLYTMDVTGTREGFRFIGYDAEELLDEQGNKKELGVKQRDAAYTLISHFGAKLLVIPMYTDVYGRHVSYVYVKYDGPIASLKGKWINLSSLMIASGYVKTIETGYHQDSEFIGKNILYNNYFNKYYGGETEGALYENSKDMYEKIRDEFILKILDIRRLLIEDIKNIQDFSGLNEQQKQDFSKSINGINSMMTVLSNIFDSISGEYIYEEKDNKLSDIGITAGSINMFINETIDAGSIENTSVYRAIIEPFNSIKSAILTVSEVMSDALRISTQYYNIVGAIEDKGPKRVFTVLNPFNEAEKYINLPGTKKFRSECIAVSRVNLISNGIMTDSANVYNEIIFKGRRNDADVWPVFKQVWRFIKSIFGVSDGNVDGDDQIHTIIADVNIPEWERKTLMAADEWADTFQTRIIVGTSILINALKNMYQGEITIIGDPSIKPHDMIYIHDEQNDIDGTAIVRTVRHHFGQGIGFVTRIEVDPIIEARDLSISRSAVWLSNIARLALAGIIISSAILTGGTSLLPALGAFSAGVAVSSGVNKIVKSIYTDQANYAAVNGQIPYQDNSENIGAYISKDVAFNLLKIKPLSKSGRPMVAGLNGYSPENVSSMKYIAERAKKSWSEFTLGLKMYGYGFEYLGSSINDTFSEIYADLLQYRESLK
jgi:endonuclease YncB( thermonuclease family)